MGRAPTRQAGGGVHPLEQLPGAQLAAGVGVRWLDGLAHEHLAGSHRRFHGPRRESSSRQWQAIPIPWGPPPLQRAPPAPAARCLGGERSGSYRVTPGLSRGGGRTTGFCQSRRRALPQLRMHREETGVSRMQDDGHLLETLAEEGALEGIVCTPERAEALLWKCFRELGF